MTFKHQRGLIFEIHEMGISSKEIVLHCQKEHNSYTSLGFWWFTITLLHFHFIISSNKETKWVQRKNFPQNIHNNNNNNNNPPQVQILKQTNFHKEIKVARNGFRHSGDAVCTQSCTLHFKGKISWLVNPQKIRKNLLKVKFSPYYCECC